MLLAAVSLIEEVAPRTLVELRVGGWRLGFTNHMLVVGLAAAAMLVVFPLLARGYRRPLAPPKGLRNLFEAILVFLRDEAVEPALGRETDRFLPLLWTLFFFILFCNLLGLVPLAGLVWLLTGGRVAHAGGAPTANVWVTGALAFCAFLLVHVGGMRRQGVKRYWRNFVPPVPRVLWPGLFLLELIGALIKPFSLAVRLFANMVASHLVIGTLLLIAAMASQSLGYASAPVSVGTALAAALLGLLEVLVAFIQAYVFMFLTALFLGAAVHPEH